MMQTSKREKRILTKADCTDVSLLFNGAEWSSSFEKLSSVASFQKSLTRLLLTIHTPCWLQLTGGTTFFHNRAAMHLPEKESFGCQQMESKRRTDRLAP